MENSYYPYVRTTKNLAPPGRRGGGLSRQLKAYTKSQILFEQYLKLEAILVR